MILTPEYSWIITSARAIPYITKSDLRREREPGPWSDWEQAGLPETLIYSDNRYSFTGKTPQVQGKQVFEYESGQDQIYITRDRKILTGKIQSL